MIKGNFEKFVELISPLSETYGDFHVYVKLYQSESSFDSIPEKDMLPLYETRTNETNHNEICFMVRGLGENEQPGEETPLVLNELIQKLSHHCERCGDYEIVLSQIDMPTSDDDPEFEEGDYIELHLPVAEIKTSSDNSNRFFLMLLPFNEDYEHVHYGNLNDPESAGVVYKNEQYNA